MAVKVGVVGYGTIGKRVADAILKQPDMELVGIVKTKPDYEARIAASKGIPVYTLSERLGLFREAGFRVAGCLEDLLESIDVVVDATPAGIGAKYKPVYEKHGLKMIFQGGESADVAEVSFNSFCNFDDARGRGSVRVVSCNTTGLLRILCTLNKAYGLGRVRATIVRRAADPKEVKRGPVNAIVPNPASIPSHHALDVKTVLPWLDIVTAAVVVPTTLMHVHIVYAELKNPPSSVDDVVKLLEETPRIVLVDSNEGFKSTADIVEAARDIGRKRYDIPELIVWRDSVTLNGSELYWIQAVHQESIVVPENIDAIRAITGLATASESIRLTDETLGLRRGRLF
ncbi:MAG: type II glyceraldehyde-3-phosphate dehydrogenase [Crenarchaeota archaeon]|nr:type II glyceraldehyde-3-phosphate dehydrogenase [Thermoproteota archaeon]